VPLDPTDALFLEVWNGLGVPLRYMAGGPKWEALQKECREMLREKLKG
jgi:hypothetical protein